MKRRNAILITMGFLSSLYLATQMGLYVGQRLRFEEEMDYRNAYEKRWEEKNSFERIIFLGAYLASVELESRTEEKSQNRAKPLKRP